MITERISLSMIAKELKNNLICQCPHCKEIIRQQNRMEKLQYLKNKTVNLVSTDRVAEHV